MAEFIGLHLSLVSEHEVLLHASPVVDCHAMVCGIDI